MIRTNRLFILLTVLSSVFSSKVILAQSDSEIIRQLVMNAYVESTQNLGSIDEIRKGFHPSFTMFRQIDNEVKYTTLDEWIVSIEQRRKDAGGKLPRTEGKILSIDITGTSAAVKMELHREGKLIFTDYLGLYKFKEGWRIVSKTYYRHPD